MKHIPPSHIVLSSLSPTQMAVEKEISCHTGRKLVKMHVDTHE